MPNLQQKIAGGIMGLLIGDALGVPYEFHNPESIPPYDQIEFEPPRGFARAHSGVAPGTWSDDGAQALCLLASLIDCDKLNLDDFGARLKKWHDHGYLAVDGIVYDVGITTRRAIRCLSSGVPASSAGLTGERDNGNGSLMRALPLALWHTGSDTELAHDAAEQSRVTHAHPRSMVCCAVYCLWARNTLNDSRDPWETALVSLREIFADSTDMLGELDLIIQTMENSDPGGTGYVIDSLISALSVQDEEDFEGVVKAAVMLGNDTDTTACVAGGIAGLIHGIDRIPVRWRANLRGQEMVRPLLDELLKIRH
jgi:ADP-ribosylglycohydrolase